jgi:hypothetical protein
MTTIRHKMSRSGWPHVLVLVLLLLGFGLTTAGPTGVAQAARGGWGGGGGMMSREGASGFHGWTASRSMGSRSRSGFNHNAGWGTAFRGSGETGFRPLSPPFIGMQQPLRPQFEARPQFAGPSMGVRGFDRLQRVPGVRQPGPSGIIGAFGRERGGFGDGGRLAFDRGGRSFRFEGRHDRFFDFDDFHHFRHFNRFDFDDFARFHRFGFFSFCPQAFFPDDTLFFPDEFLFGPWFGTNTCWWWNHVYPDSGVTVILQF